MTSSQALTLNVFAPLLADLAWFRRCLDHLFPGIAMDVGSASVEWGPPDRYARLRERTMADVAVLGSGSDTVPVIFEIKYADRFTARLLDVHHSAQHQALNDSHRLWTPSEPPTLNVRGVNQLARVHALGAAYSSHAPLLVLLHHPWDLAATDTADQYARIVASPDTVRRLPIPAFLLAMAATAQTSRQRDEVQRLTVRYDDTYLRSA